MPYTLSVRVPPKPTTLDLGRAVKLAVKSLQADARRLAFDANLYDKMHVVSPLTVKASKRRAELLAAIAELEKLAEIEKKTVRAARRVVSGIGGRS